MGKIRKKNIHTHRGHYYLFLWAGEKIYRFNFANRFSIISYCTVTVLRTAAVSGQSRRTLAKETFNSWRWNSSSLTKLGLGSNYHWHWLTTIAHRTFPSPEQGCALPFPPPANRKGQDTSSSGGWGVASDAGEKLLIAVVLLFSEGRNRGTMSLS